MCMCVCVCVCVYNLTHVLVDDMMALNKGSLLPEIYLCGYSLVSFPSILIPALSILFRATVAPCSMLNSSDS